MDLGTLKGNIEAQHGKFQVVDTLTGSKSIINNRPTWDFGYYFTGWLRAIVQGQKGSQVKLGFSKGTFESGEATGSSSFKLADNSPTEVGFQFGYGTGRFGQVSAPKDTRVGGSPRFGRIK